MYAWGQNGFGQLGTGNKANQCTPVRIAQDIGRIVNIACTHYCHISTAMTQGSKVYMWGQCKGILIITQMRKTVIRVSVLYLYFKSENELYLRNAFLEIIV